MATLGDTDQIIALHEVIIDHSGTWLVNFSNTYLGAADHHLGVLARALGRTDEAEQRLRAALASKTPIANRAELERVVKELGSTQ